MDALAARADHSWVRDLEVDPEAEKNFPNRRTRPVSAPSPSPIFTHASHAPARPKICTNVHARNENLVLGAQCGGGYMLLIPVLCHDPSSPIDAARQCSLTSWLHSHCIVHPTQVKSGHYVPVLPTPLPNPKLVIFSRRLARELGEQSHPCPLLYTRAALLYRTGRSPLA